MKRKDHPVLRRTSHRGARHSQNIPHQVFRAAVPLAVVSLIVMLMMWGVANAGAAAGVTSADPKGPSVTNFTKHPWCGGDGQAACPLPEPGWIQLNGPTPGDVIAAIKTSDIFRTVNSNHGGKSLDLPALVHTIASPSGYDYFDDNHWVVSVRDGKNIQVGVFDFVYDRANQRIRFASYGTLIPKDARFGHAFPWTTASAASGRLQAERGLGLKLGSQPDLVFFHVSDAALGPQASQVWSGGGGSPVDAMWRVTGADGVQYFVGQDRHVYVQSELPLFVRPGLH
jgi:hypothetical protein